MQVVNLDKARDLDQIADGFLQEMFIRFHASYGDTATIISDHLDARRFQEAQKLVHSMVGISGSLGAEQVSLATTKLDRLLRQGADAPQITAAFGDVEAALDRLITYIRDTYRVLDD